MCLTCICDFCTFYHHLSHLCQLPATSNPKTVGGMCNAIIETMGGRNRKASTPILGILRRNRNHKLDSNEKQENHNSSITTAKSPQQIT